MRTHLAVCVLLIISFSFISTQNNPSDPLNYLTDYNAFFFNNFASSQVDCQGAMAVGNNCNLTSYEVGTYLTSGCSYYSLVVGNDLYFVDGGTTETILYGNEIMLSGVSDPCGYQQGTLIQFSTAESQFISVSNTIAEQAVNGQTVFSYQNLQITGTAAQTFVVIDATQLAFSTSISIDIPENSWIFITVEGSNVTFENLAITTSPSTNLSYVLWNFAQATNLYLTGLSVQGSILAPNAIISFSNGNIDGSICGNSFYGNGELHLVPYVPPSQCICPVCPPSLTFPPYSIFVEKYVALNHTDDEGPLAAGGDVYLENYEVAARYDPDSNILVLAVGGDLYWNSGTLNGYGDVAGSVQTYNVYGTIYNYTSPNIDFTSTFQTFSAFANSLAALPSNGNIAFYNGDLVLTGNSRFNVFTLASGVLSQVNSWTINAAVDSEVIVNLPGDDNVLANFEMNLVGGIQNTTILLNFYETTDLTIEDISVQGTVLAPLAVVRFYNSNVEGDLIALALYGDGEVHLSPPAPIEPVCPPCNCPPNLF